MRRKGLLEVGGAVLIAVCLMAAVVVGGSVDFGGPRSDRETVEDASEAATEDAGLVHKVQEYLGFHEVSGEVDGERDSDGSTLMDQLRDRRDAANADPAAP
ncbi:MAG: hypothetical protein ACE5E0_04105 [Terriglobia bacterium]